MNNYYAVCPVRRRRIGTPSWWASLQYSLHQLLHWRERRREADEYV